MANRFWKSQPVSGAIVSVTSPPAIRLTVASTTGMANGDFRHVSGVGGTTEANGLQTIDVIDTTHIDLRGTTFTNVYTSGGVVNGQWNGSNTNNWVTTSGGTNYGQTVPGINDAVIFDGSSGGGTVIVNTTITVQSITCGAWTGTLDFSTNNNDVTLSVAAAFNASGTGTRTINLGNGTWSMTNAGATPWEFTTITNLTFNANSSILSFSGSSANARVITLGASLVYNVINIGANSLGGTTSLNSTGSTIGTLNLTGPLACRLATCTITNFSITNSAASPVALLGVAINVTSTLTITNAVTVSYCGIRDITAANLTAANSFDLGHNSLAALTPPTMTRSRGFSGFA